jgi:hypothetical protein
MSFLSKALTLDRRWIFLSIGVVVILFLLLPITLPVDVTPESQGVYDTIETLPEGSPIIVALDFDPPSKPELEPMALALIRHCFRKNLKVVAMGLWITGAPLIEQDINQVKANGFPDKKYGEDYVNLGVKVGGYVVVNTMARSIRDAFPTDYYQTPLEQLPMMQNIKTLRDVPVVISLSAGDPGIKDAWVPFAHQRYHCIVAGGCTAVSVSEFSPYLQARQLSGLLGGMRGAAEYEKLVNAKALATKGMNAQSFAHLLIILFIVFGNVAFFLTRKHKEKAP